MGISRNWATTHSLLFWQCLGTVGVSYVIKLADKDQGLIKVHLSALLDPFDSKSHVLTLRPWAPSFFQKLCPTPSLPVTVPLCQALFQTFNHGDQGIYWRYTHYSHFQKRNWGAERWSKLPKITQLKRGSCGIWAKARCLEPSKLCWSSCNKTSEQFLSKDLGGGMGTKPSYCARVSLAPAHLIC